MRPFLTLVLLMCLLQFTQAQNFTTTYDHSALAVSDLDESAAFYADVLNLTEIVVPYENPILRWFSLGGELQLHLIESDTEEIHTTRGVHLSVHVSDLDAFIAHLKNNNIPYSDWPGEDGKVSLRPDGIKQVYVQDPDGYWIEVNDRKI